MALSSRVSRDTWLLLAGCFLLLLLLGQVSPRRRKGRKDKRDICLLPSDKGPCRARILQWYHDRYTKTCKIFYYGGCEGNDNNFESKEDCEQACHVKKNNRDFCLLPSEGGPCKAYIRRWYHDQDTQTCNMFIWGGCGGNDNNFESKEDCEQACHVKKNNRDFCLLPSEGGPCKAYIRRWYHDQDTQTCNMFIWGGCGGNDNNFESKEDCEQACHVKKNNRDICLLPSHRGACLAYIRRWYHDQDTQTCKTFIWGGCGGNDNNFESKEDCEQACHVKKNNRDFCLLPSEGGPCKAYIRRWYHDQDTQTCNTFIWGGCGGNDNNFESKEDCEQACHVKKKNKESCLLPKDVGLCRAIIPRWYFNQDTKTCKEFDWGGCGGNDNNFESEEECEQACHMIKRIPKECELEPSKGKCRSYYKRYFFNINTLKCEKFFYGGCKGNENRFLTKFSCMEHCLPGKSSVLASWNWEGPSRQCSLIFCCAGNLKLDSGVFLLDVQKKGRVYLPLWSVDLQQQGVYI